MFLPLGSVRLTKVCGMSKSNGYAAPSAGDRDHSRYGLTRPGIVQCPDGPNQDAARWYRQPASADVPLHASDRYVRACWQDCARCGACGDAPGRGAGCQPPAWPRSVRAAASSPWLSSVLAWPHALTVCGTNRGDLGNMDTRRCPILEPYTNSSRASIMSQLWFVIAKKPVDVDTPRQRHHLAVDVATAITLAHLQPYALSVTMTGRRSSSSMKNRSRALEELMLGLLRTPRCSRRSDRHAAPSWMSQGGLSPIASPFLGMTLP